MTAHEMNPVTVTCAKCRRELVGTALFCPSCGAPRVSESAADPLVGKVLGERFLILDRAGQGASGTIYRAEHVTLRRKVAVKVLHHELSRDDLAVERFRREATTVAEIDNEHIVEIHDFGRTPDGRLYLAMELLEGETLDAVISRDGRLSIERTVDILIQAGEALAEAHAIGYVHRDLRPRNLYLAMRRGRANFVKVLDFGLAKLVEHEGAASTSLGMTFGDPRYMSPEQARGDRIDRRADIYQLGCVAYEMLIGQPPFTGGRVFDMLSRHVGEAPVAPSTHRRDLPRWLEAAVLRMLSKRPDDRFATTTRMIEALRQGLTTGEIMAEAVARRRESVPPPSVSRIMQKMGISTDSEAGVPVELPVEVPVHLRSEASVPAEPSPADSARKARLAPARPESEDASATRSRVSGSKTGTPVVGVPVVAAAPRSAPVPGPRPADGDAVPAPMPAAATLSRSEALGKGARPVVPFESAGISQAWYADGDRLEGGRPLEENQARRLETARAVISPSNTGLIDDDYYDGRRRPWGKIVALATGGVVAVAAVVLAWPSGGSSPARPRAPVAALPADAGAPPAYGAATPPAYGAATPALVTDAKVETPPTAARPVPDDGSGSHARAVDASRREPAPSPAGRTPSPAPAKPAPTPAKPAPASAKPTPEPVDPYVDDENARKAEFFARLGEQGLRAGDYGAAAGNFKKALEIDPRSVDAMTGLGEIALQQGLYGDALVHLKKASRAAPRNPRIHTLLGEAFLNSGNAASAEASFRKALQLDPDNARARDGYNEAVGRLPPVQDEP